MTTAEAIRQPRGAFAALTVRSYRIYLAGQSLANTGSWMQSIAQDWLIFDLTHSSAAVGVTMALQFGPILLLGMHAGIVADRLQKRRILLVTQLLNAVAVAVLAVITIAGAVTAADVYLFALLSGVIFAFDGPARQAFVTDVVPEGRLRAAISLNAAVFQAARLVGPALASVLIVCAGTGWVFAANAACYLGPTVGLLLLRPADLQPARCRDALARTRRCPPAHRARRARRPRTCGAGRRSAGPSSSSACSARSASTSRSCSPRWRSRRTAATRAPTACSTSSSGSARRPARCSRPRARSRGPARS